MEALVKTTKVLPDDNTESGGKCLKIKYKKAPNSNLQNVNFDIIRYANCWEDAEVLINALQPKQGERILSVGSGGDNSFALLTTNPSLVMAVDLNEVQLFVIELKKYAIKYLSYNEFIELTGFKESLKRRVYFNRIATFLSSDCRKYWLKNFDIIKEGLIYGGKFEKYLLTFGKKILPLIVGKKNIKKYFEKKTQSELVEFYQKKWNNWRWRTFFKLFFSKWIMGKFGRTPEFMHEVKIDVGDFIFNKTENHLKCIEAQNNEFLRFIMNGNFGENLPYYARPENFEIIKKNIDKLELYKGYIEDLFRRDMNFDCYNLSNIFEYMSDSFFTQVAHTISNSLKDGSRVAYWNLMVKRKISEVLPFEFSYCKDVSENLSKCDKGFFYRDFNLDIKTEQK